MSDDVPTPLFRRTAEGVIATPLCRGPWDPNAAHGGPIAALIGHFAVRHDPHPDLLPVRFTIELLRPVPLGELAVATSTIRPGNRVRIVEVRVSAHDLLVASATVVFIARVPELALVDPSAPTFPGPEEAAPAVPLVTQEDGITAAVELRAARGSAVVSGPGTYWFRPTASFIDDEPFDALERLLVAADFGNGIASVVPIATHLFINPELTVHIHRLPVGEWVANDAHTWVSSGQSSFADGTLYDREGMVAKAMQSLLIAERTS